jgi:hypothetical protein
MRRFLVVGCGGAGGSTLAYMMDQLRSDLGAAGVTALPRGWQFVHIDVPGAPDDNPDGLPNVRDQGGTYFGCAPTGGQYTLLDDAITGRMAEHAGSLGEIATWAPRDPGTVRVQITAGAGQYRALGRMITLSRAEEILKELTAAWQRLFSVETATELAGLAGKVPGLGAFEAQADPCVVVVSSMSGGSGSSMTLDVCRLLSMVPNLPTKLISLFVVSADVFDDLAPDLKRGVTANGLAMLGEIVSSQTGAAGRHDAAVLASLGIEAGASDPVPFARVFPVGRFVGTQQTQFGDGSRPTVYRGLGRGLAALMMSGAASNQFIAYDLDNAAPLSDSGDFLGWGVPDRSWIPWGSFGYACLSVGRERYREYAAQRIAKGAVDRLVVGHLELGNPASGVEQVKALLASQWEGACTSLKLPSDQHAWLAWLSQVALPNSDRVTRGILSAQLTPFLPQPAGQVAGSWLAALRVQLMQRRAEVVNAVNEAMYSWAYQWQRELAASVVSQVEQAVARFGLAYARGFVDRVEEHLRSVVMECAQRDARQVNVDIGAVPKGTEGMVGKLKGVIVNGQEVLDRFVDEMARPLRTLLLGRACTMLERASIGLVEDVLRPLNAAVSEALVVLEAARDDTGKKQASNPALEVGLAHLQTDLYAAWPPDPQAGATAFVPARFDHATNEVLLTSSKHFDAQFRANIVSSVPKDGRAGGDGAGGDGAGGDGAGGAGAGGAGAGGLSDTAEYYGARAAVLGMVIAGSWPATGGAVAPGGLIEQTNEWYSNDFARVPGAAETMRARSATFRVHVRPAEVLGRARLFVSRPNESFEKFCRVSLSEYVADEHIPEIERQERGRTLVSSFAEALTLALPLANVGAEVVQKLYAQPVMYRYKFSEVPFKTSSIAPELSKVLEVGPNVDSAVAGANFERALVDNSNATKIDIFGSYPIYLPLVFKGLLSPAAEQWAREAVKGRGEFWKWRRARALPAGLPMGDRERRAMVAGWFVGQLVGEVRIPNRPPFDGPVEIWDCDSEKWTSFPHPLLTPPSEFYADHDWVAAVLESVLVAISQVPRPPILSSLRPYRLLRDLYGANPAMPVGRKGIIPLGCEQKLREWLRSGKTASGTPSRVSAGSCEGRAEKAATWLEQVDRMVREEYLPPAEGPGTGGGGGAFAVIRSREVAGKTPMFRDLAVDVADATSELRTLVMELTAEPVAESEPPRVAEASRAFKRASPEDMF